MGITIITTTNARATGYRVAEDALAKGRAVAWLLPDEQRALTRQRSLAAAAGARLGVTCASFDSFVVDCWELFGEGMPCVNSLQRELLLRRVCEEAAQEGMLPVSVQVAMSVLADAAREGVGSAFPLPDAADVVWVAAVLTRYGRALRDCDLCERAEVLCALANDDEAVWHSLVLEGWNTLSPLYARFVARVAQRTDVTFLIERAPGSSFDAARLLVGALEAAGAQVSVAEVDETEAPAAADELRALSAALYASQPEASVQATGAVRALVPAGRYAEARMIAESVVSNASPTTLIACNDPLELAQRLAPLVADAGFSVEAYGSLSFSETDFGCLLLNVWAAADGTAEAATITDIVFNPLCGVSLSAVYAFDKKNRHNRLFCATDALAAAQKLMSADAALVVAQLAAGEYDAAFASAEALCPACARMTLARRVENLAAVQAARRALEAAEALGMELDKARDALATQRVQAAREYPASEQARGVVRLVTHERAVAEPPTSWDAVYACNLNAAEQPLRTTRTSVDVLLERAGVTATRDGLFEARVRFAAAVRTAREGVVLVRTLHDAQAEPLYPAVMFEDVADCYCAQAHDSAEIDKATALPVALLPYARQCGEEELSANMGGAAATASRATLKAGPADKVSDTAKPLIVLPRQGVATGTRILSPSSVESYIECPRKWFSLRRLGLDSADAEFGAKEKGTFAHDVLRRFYARWQEAHGTSKPRGEDLAAADNLLSQVFDELAVAQLEKDPRDNPLIPVTETERRQMAELKRNLQEFLRRDAAFLPGFEPRYFEYSFGVNNPVEYAGCSLVGTIDRVDFDAQGRAAIIDYKSSLNGDYCVLSEKGAAFSLPPHVQTLMYAQALRRAVGVEPAAALYVHISHLSRADARPAVCGAYDDNLLGPLDLPGINVSRNALSAAGFSSFGDLLDEVEEVVAQRVQELLQGNVAARPRTEKACDYCPVLRCKGRRA